MYSIVAFALLSIMPSGAANINMTRASIDSAVSAIDSIDRHLNQNFRVFCSLIDSSRVLPIPDTLIWPDWESIDATYNVVTDSNGAIVKLGEAPISQSGDWVLDVSYYYDDEGRLMRIDTHYSTFTSGCTEIFREHMSVYYSKTGDEVLRLRKFTDENDKPIDTTGCEMDNDEASRLFKTTSDVRKLLGL
ncbi:MAG: hypothetical protein WAU88_04195 [Candidatus Zixiibacteriota bacterium]